MDRPVVWAAPACDDLDQIAEYIAKDSAHYAATFVTEVIAAARSLSEFAERGRHVPELADDHVRELVIGNYRLVYEVADDAVYVLGVIHGARNLRRLWPRRES